uniref:Mediator of DNA damage checkpoint protein 1 n=1 Tax=Glossina pallidipes TaxID=7398 RepID=A0A1B0AI19_GLOPL
MFGETAATLQLQIENNQYFLEKGIYLIGNDRRRGRSRNYIQVTNSYVDAKHCVLEVDSNEDVFIVDLESESGIYVNNKRVDPLTKERLKPDEDFSFGGQLKARIKLIEREESHNGNHLENISVIKDIMPRPILKDERVQQLNLENRISHDNHDSVNVPAVQSHQPTSTCSAARATNIDNSVNQNSPNGEQEVGNVSMPEIQEVKIEYPDSDDYTFIQSVPMTSAVRIDGGENDSKIEYPVSDDYTFIQSVPMTSAVRIDGGENDSKIEYPVSDDYTFIQSVPMTSAVRIGGGENDSAQLISKKTEKTKNVEMLFPDVTIPSQQAERAQTSHATISFQGCDEYSIQNNNKSKQVARKSLGNKKATNINKRANQNSPNGDQEVVNSHTAKITEVKIEYPDSDDYTFIQSVPMTSAVRIGGGENDSAQLISKKTEKTKNVEMLFPHVTISSQQAERAQTSHATTSFQGSMQNNKKIKQIVKKGLENKKAIAGREKESNKSRSNDGIESSYTSENAVPKTKKSSNMSARNIATQGILRRRSTRCHTVEFEPSCFNELPENNEFETKRVTRSQTRKKESNNTEHEMPGRRLTRSYTQEGERTRFIELGANHNETQKVNVTLSNVHKKERKTSLPLPSDVVPTQPLAHFMEIRARLRNTNRPSSSNGNNAGSSGNVAKRKGGTKFNSKKSKYQKKKTTVATLQLEIENHRYSLEKGRYLIGKDSRKGRSANYIQLTDRYLDAKHCLLEIDSNEDVFIVDLESDSGIYVNNKRVDPLTKERLTPDEDFSLGGQLKAKIKLVGRQESHNGNRSLVSLTNTSNIKKFTLRPITGQNNVQRVHDVESNNLIGHNDSLLLPETQSRTCTSDVANNISLNNISFNDEEEDFCVPETQEVKATDPDLDDGSFVNKANSVADSIDVDEVTGSQFRICTQEFNDENKMEDSQIIPIIKHNIASQSESGRILTQLQSNKEKTGDMSPIHLPSAERTQIVEISSGPAFRDETATPDILDFLELTDMMQEVRNEMNNGNVNNVTGDEQDLVPTQAFPTRGLFKNRPQNETLGIGKFGRSDPLLTLRDKENTYPPSEVRSKSIFVVANGTSVHDNPDDVLTEEFLRLPTSRSAAMKTCLNSSFLKDKPNSPTTLFKDAETKKTQTSNLCTFKKPLNEYRTVKSNTSTPSNSSISDSDVDLLLCTPQLIKEHINISGVALLVATNNDVLDSNVESEEIETNSVVKLFKKKPKENKDFDMLLPHVKNSSQHAERFKISHKTDRVKLLNREDSSENDSKYIGKGKQGNRNKEIITKGEKESNNSPLSKELEKSPFSKRNAQKTVKKREATTVMREVPKERLTRARTRERELQNSTEVHKVDSKSGTSVKSNPITVLPARRSARLKTLDQELRGSIDLSKCAGNISSNIRGKNRSSSLYSQSKDGDEIDLIPTQPFVRTMETRTRSTSCSSSKEGKLKNELKRKCLDAHSSKDSSKRSKNMSAEGSHIPLTSTSCKRCLQISATMVDKDVFEELMQNSRGLWTVANDPLDSELLIMDKGSRTYKFLLAMAKGIPIVTTEWIKKVNESRALIPFKNDFFSDPVFERKHKFSVLKSLGMARSKSLFKGCRFFTTSKIRPQPGEIRNIIKCAGGYVHNEYDKVIEKKEGKIYLVSCSDDKKDWHTLRHRYKNITIVPSEAIMSAIMRQDVTLLDKIVLS